MKMGWIAQLQRVGDFHIVELPERGNVTTQMWELLRKTYIFIQVTTIADITTTCGRYFTEAAI